MAAIAYRTPLLGLAIWMAIFPLVAAVTVPVGLEKLSPTRLVNLILIAVTIVGVLRAGHRIECKGSLLLAYALFVSAALMSALASSIPSESLGRAASYAEPGIWLFIGAAVRPDHAERDLKSLLAGCTIGFALVVLLSVPEVHQQHNYLVDAGLVRSDKDYMLDRRLDISGRVVSTIGQPVYAGLYAVVCLCVVHLLLRRGMLSALEQLMMLGLAIMGSVFLFLTGTRATLLGFLLYPALFFLFVRDRAALWKLMGFYALFTCAVVAFLPEKFLTFARDSFSLTAATGSSANVIGRLALTKRLLDVFAAHPILGTGPGYIQKTVFSHGAVSLAGLEGAENQYALILAENGLVGLLLFGVFVFLAFRIALRIHRSGSGPIGREFGYWLAAVLACVLMLAVSCSVMGSIPMYYVMALIGCVAAIDGATRSVKGAAV